MRYVPSLRSVRQACLVVPFTVVALLAAPGARAQGQPAASATPPVAPSATAADAYADLQWRNIGPFRGGRVVAVTGV